MKETLNLKVPVGGVAPISLALRGLSAYQEKRKTLAKVALADGCRKASPQSSSTS